MNAVPDYANSHILFEGQAHARHEVDGPGHVGAVAPEEAVQRQVAEGHAQGLHAVPVEAHVGLFLDQRLGDAGTRDHWPEVVDGLHRSIDAAFRKADIEIAFPQRDLHLRSIVSTAAPEEFLRERSGTS